MLLISASIFAAVAVSSLRLTQTAAVAVAVAAPNCDLYQGNWVFDTSYPLYRPEICPFMIQQFNCTGNGRSDLRYQRYRWQPNNCSLPRWNGVDFGRRMRGKSIMFVGDSLSMNQWQSLACMIYAANPTSLYQPTKSEGLLSTIVFTQLNITLMYLRNAFIVDLVMQNGQRVLNLDSVARSSKQWLDSNVLIFDTWHWWLHSGRKQPWDAIQDGSALLQDMDRLEAYQKALRTWGRWVDKKVNLDNHIIFFQGVSPDHLNGSNWGGQGPQKQEMGGDDTNKADVILKEVLRDIKKPVHLLDISKSSEFRVDGHPYIYGNPRHVGMDCTHWCLPGVPDVWNQFLYATILDL